MKVFVLIGYTGRLQERRSVEGRGRGDAARGRVESDYVRMNDGGRGDGGWRRTHRRDAHTMVVSPGVLGRRTPRPSWRPVPTLRGRGASVPHLDECGWRSPTARPATVSPGRHRARPRGGGAIRGPRPVSPGRATRSSTTERRRAAAPPASDYCCRRSWGTAHARASPHSFLVSSSARELVLH